MNIFFCCVVGQIAQEKQVMQKISKTFFPILGKIRKSHFFMNLLRDFWVQSYSGAEYSGFPIEENILKGNEIWRQLEHPSLNLEEINELSVSSIRYITWTSAELKKKEEDCPTPPPLLVLNLWNLISGLHCCCSYVTLWQQDHRKSQLFVLLLVPQNSRNQGSEGLLMQFPLS